MILISCIVYMYWKRTYVIFFPLILTIFYLNLDIQFLFSKIYLLQLNSRFLLFFIILVTVKLYMEKMRI